MTEKTLTRISVCETLDQTLPFSNYFHSFLIIIAFIYNPNMTNIQKYIELLVDKCLNKEYKTINGKKFILICKRIHNLFIKKSKQTSHIQGISNQ